MGLINNSEYDDDVGLHVLGCRFDILGTKQRIVVDRFYIAIFSALAGADSLRSHVILHERLAVCCAFLNIHRSGVLTALAWLVPRETAAISARSVCIIQPSTMSLHAKPHTYKINLLPALLAE